MFSSPNSPRDTKIRSLLEAAWQTFITGECLYAAGLFISFFGTYASWGAFAFSGLIYTMVVHLFTCIGAFFIFNSILKSQWDPAVHQPQFYNKWLWILIAESLFWGFVIMFVKKTL